jgi:hypothetical protein
VSFLRKIFGGKDDLAPAAQVDLDIDQRKAQLLELERVLDKLVEVMKANDQRMSNPAWRERMAEYRRLSGESYRLRAGSFTREQILDLAFEIRPVFTGDLPEDVRVVQPLQAQLLEAAAALQDVLPDERREA